MNASKIVQTAIAQGGGTFDPKSGNAIRPRSGFSVGAVKGTLIQVSAENPDVVEDAVKIVTKRFPGSWLGLWVNKGVVHIDPVMWVPSRDAAESLGRKLEQDSIFDFSNGEVIVL